MHVPTGVSSVWDSGRHCFGLGTPVRSGTPVHLQGVASLLRPTGDLHQPILRIPSPNQQAGGTSESGNREVLSPTLHPPTTRVESLSSLGQILTELPVAFLTPSHSFSVCPRVPTPPCSHGRPSPELCLPSISDFDGASKFGRPHIGISIKLPSPVSEPFLGEGSLEVPIAEMVHPHRHCGLQPQTFTDAQLRASCWLYHRLVRKLHSPHQLSRGWCSLHNASPGAN